MILFVTRRVVWAAAIMFAAATITFILSRVVPANPAAFLAGQNAPAETVARIRSELGLDRPLPEQYVAYLTGLVTGDLGDSIRTRRPVSSDLAEFLPATLELLLVSFALYLLVSLVLGVVAARRSGGIIDSAIRLLTMSSTGIPVFWLGLVLQFVFFYRLGWLPLDGRFPVRDTPPEPVTGFLLVDSVLAGEATTLGATVAHLVLPTITVVASLLAVGTRLTRATVVEQFEQPYVRTARGKGFGENRLLYKHVLRNAINPLLTVTGIQFGYMLSWIILVEVIFNWPGIGLYAFRSFEVFDYSPVIALTLISTLAFAAVNLVSDLLYPVVDPRVKQVAT